MLNTENFLSHAGPVCGAVHITGGVINVADQVLGGALVLGQITGELQILPGSFPVGVRTCQECGIGLALVDVIVLQQLQSLLLVAPCGDGNRTQVVDGGADLIEPVMDGFAAAVGSMTLTFGQ